MRLVFPRLQDALRFRFHVLAYGWWGRCRHWQHDPGRSRSCNPLLRRPMPHTLDHGATGEDNHLHNAAAANRARCTRMRARVCVCVSVIVCMRLRVPVCLSGHVCTRVRRAGFCCYMHARSQDIFDALRIALSYGAFASTDASSP